MIELLNDNDIKNELLFILLAYYIHKKYYPTDIHYFLSWFDADMSNCDKHNRYIYKSKDYYQDLYTLKMKLLMKG